MTKEYNWRTDYNWMDTNDHPVDEAVEDCKLIPTLSTFWNLSFAYCYFVVCFMH